MADGRMHNSRKAGPGRKHQQGKRLLPPEVKLMRGVTHAHSWPGGKAVWAKMRLRSLNLGGFDNFMRAAQELSR